MENVRLESEALTGDSQQNDAAATSEKPSETEEILIPIKFNKEIRKLTLDEAGALAQKGLKFEAIADDYEHLKQLALKDGKSVSAFLQALRQAQSDNRKKELAEQCGGNEEIAEYVIKLEGGEQNDPGFEELQASFPEIRSLRDLPEEVVENARLTGRLLLDEYLRYRLHNQRSVDRAAVVQKAADQSSIGSLKDRTGGSNPETEEFIKGLWK